ncbi:M15 family metallopeptidase [Microbacterium flavum]|nr:M15 family metallopeptidase [Microbacterium flavum]
MLPPEPLPSRRALRAGREGDGARPAQGPGGDTREAGDGRRDRTRDRERARAGTPILAGVRGRRGIIVAVVAVAVIAVGVGVGGMIGSLNAAAPADGRAVDAAAVAEVVPGATSLPVPAQTSAATAAVCDDPTVTTALAQGSDAEVLSAFGGAATFRSTVAGGGAPCVSLADPAREWVVVNKQRPLVPIDWEPDPVIAPADMQRTVDGRLRPAAADALTALVATAQAEGAGAIGLNSAFRSFSSQTRTYNGYVDSLGRDAADLQSARPGFSEHQTGLATDVAACDGGCGAIEDLGGTPQGAWVAANAWRFGFVVRYEDGYTPVTGYQAEPWHLRYIGPELAQVYHDGGYHTLEEFFGLPAAPDYAD